MAEYFAGITDKGKRREKNEDTFIARELFKKKFVVACVIDGVGGYNGGDVAAAIAREVILEHLKNLPEDLDISITLQSAVLDANSKILEEKKKGNKNEQMACVLTCAVADIKNNKLYYAHVGDTRLYLLRDYSLVKLSKDHSVVGFLEDSGRLSEEDAMNHPRRNEITKALGFEEYISDIREFIETGESPFLPGDTILVCSDGLSDMISSSTIRDILLNKKGLAEKAGELVAAANEAGGNDNITVVIVQNINKPAPKVVLKPVIKSNSTEKEKSPAGKILYAEEFAIPAGGSRSFIVLLILVSITLSAFLLFKSNEMAKGSNLISKMTFPKPGKENFDQFIYAVKDSVKNFSVDPKELLILSEPILVSKDSFYIKGNGITISSDSNYKGPAFIINSTARQIVLDSIIFKDIDVAVVVQKNNILFKNVRFINCRVPVQYQVSLPDTMISGRLKDSIFITTPTIKKSK